MPWENRKGGGRYYTRSIKTQDKIEREYIGTGIVAELAATIDEIDRENRAVEAEHRREVDEELAEIEKQLVGLSRTSDRLIRATLQGAGCYRSRGAWKRRRVPDGRPLGSQMEIGLLIEQTSSWAEIGTISQSIERLCIDLVPGSDPAQIETNEQRLALWRASLTAGSSSPIERALVELVVATSAYACLLDVIDRTRRGGDPSPPSKKVQDRHALAMKRRQHCIKSLTLVRELLGPG